MTDLKPSEEPRWPATEYTAVTIPVHISLEAREAVLCQPEAEELLRRAQTIALQACECREEHRGCDAPLDVCLALDQAAEEAVARGRARVVDFETALEALERSHRAGLVHLAYRKPGESPNLLCSCCSCCCWCFRKLEGFHYHDAIAESAYVASFAEEACARCQACVGRCPFGAWQIDEGDLGRVSLRRDRCFGCGLCTSACPAGAITLVRRAEEEK